MLKEFFAFADTIFSNKEQDLSFNDWELISSVGSGDQLHLLFFPEKATRDPWLVDEWKEKELPLLKVPAVFGKCKFKNRRPDFLIHFNDEEYVAVFRRLRENPGLVLPTWQVTLETN